MNQCPNIFYGKHITRNRTARDAPPINFCDGGNGGNVSHGRVGSGGREISGGHGCGGGGGRVSGNSYGKGDFSSPYKNDTVHVVNGKAYAACKDCGWNIGYRAHMSGVHKIYIMSGYSLTFALKTNMNNL